MPRFKVKDLLIATALIAIGLGMWALLFRSWEGLFDEGMGGVLDILLLWFGGGACIGAGLFTPFKRPWTGVIGAFFAQILVAVIHL
jgi:hypothetical protein